MGKRSGLGKGLGALIPTQRDEEHSESVWFVAVTEISPNPSQPRARFDSDALSDLAQSIVAHGVIQPLIVTRQDQGYTLIAGERRWRAAQLAGLSSVPVIVKETTPQEMLELALIENVQRADLNALEEALAYQQLIEEFKLTQEQVAQRVGKARPTVANILRILKMPDSVQQAVLDNHLSAAHAREIMRLPTPEMQENATRQVMRLHLSRRQTATLVDSLLAIKKPQPKQRKNLTAELRDVQQNMEHALGTRVQIEPSKKGGKVIIYYYSDEELNTVYEQIIASDNEP